MSDLIAELGNPPQRKLQLAEWILAQTPEVRAALEKAALDKRWTDSGLEQLLRRKGVAVSLTSIRAWREKHDTH